MEIFVSLSHIHSLKSEFLTTMTTKITVLQDEMLCNQAARNHSFEGSCCLNLEGRNKLFLTVKEFGLLL